MINKKHFGRRVADFRRRQGLSQAELAERMGVSAQAVSKWETGAALPDIELLLELSGFCGVSVNELLEDNSLLVRLTGRPPEERGGVACYVPETETTQWERDMCEQRWIEKNWRDAWGRPGGWGEGNPLGERNRPNNLRTGREIAERGGIILEIGAGPGGGYMPYILQADPAAQVIVSDLSRTVVEEWKTLLDRELDSPHLCFATLDFCAMPFSDCTVDVVSDRGGIINCIGDRKAALREVYRVLKPGGLFVSLNGFVTRDALATLPEPAQRTLVREFPQAFDNLYEDTVLAGFRKIDSVVQGVWTTDEDRDSGIAELAARLGVTVQFTEYVRFCEK